MTAVVTHDQKAVELMAVTAKPKMPAPAAVKQPKVIAKATPFAPKAVAKPAFSSAKAVRRTGGPVPTTSGLATKPAARSQVVKPVPSWSGGGQVEQMPTYTTAPTTARPAYSTAGPTVAAPMPVSPGSVYGGDAQQLDRLNQGNALAQNQSWIERLNSQNSALRGTFPAPMVQSPAAGSFRLDANEQARQAALIRALRGF